MPRIKNMKSGPLILNEVTDKPIKMEAGSQLDLPESAMFSAEIQRLVANGALKKVADASAPVKPKAAPKAKVATVSEDQRDTVVTVGPNKEVKKTTTEKAAKTTKSTTKKNK
jgi:hypothetical protein